MLIGCTLIDRLVEEAMSGKYLDGSFSLPCPPGLDIPPEIVHPFTSNNLKFLLLLGCFALFWSLYYTLEVTLAHLDLRVHVCRRWGRHRARRGRRGRGVEDVAVEEDQEEEEVDSGVELHAVLDSEAKASLLGRDQLVRVVLAVNFILDLPAHAVGWTFVSHAALGDECETVDVKGSEDVEEKEEEEGQTVEANARAGNQCEGCGNCGSLRGCGVMRPRLLHS
ncbi:hypothetical protein INR49_015837 [Caranx melampygus]|nr:hypothetical protein INR49_015837 [Caranx melampygus]